MFENQLKQLILDQKESIHRVSLREKVYSTRWTIIPVTGSFPNTG